MSPGLPESLRRDYSGAITMPREFETKGAHYFDFSHRSQVIRLSGARSNNAPTRFLNDLPHVPRKTGLTHNVNFGLPSNANEYREDRCGQWHAGWWIWNGS
jgi:hypothetical protein